jgi:hypothetical protein
MVGASKLNEQQVQEIKRLFATTMLCDEDIADMYGVSRPFINLIRNGKRWNEEERSFVMKDDIKRYTGTNTIIGDNHHSSQITPVETTTGRLFIILHYINDEVFHEPSRVFNNEPDYYTLREHHDLFVKRFFYSN